MSRPKTGRERKQKRKARQKADRALPVHWQSEDNRKKEREGNAFVRKYLRWQTESKPTDFQNEDGTTKDPQKMTAKELAMVVTMRNMLSSDSQTAQAAVKNLLQMEQQNQKDQQKPKEPEQHLHVHATTNAETLSKTSDEELVELLAQLRGSNVKGVTKAG